jgi:hypothetical protein
MRSSGYATLATCRTRYSTTSPKTLPGSRRGLRRASVLATSCHACPSSHASSPLDQGVGLGHRRELPRGRRRSHGIFVQSVTFRARSLAATCFGRFDSDESPYGRPLRARPHPDCDDRRGRRAGAETGALDRARDRGRRPCPEPVEPQRQRLRQHLPTGRRPLDESAGTTSSTAPPTPPAGSPPTNPRSPSVQALSTRVFGFSSGSLRFPRPSPAQPLSCWSCGWCAAVGDGPPGSSPASCSPPRPSPSPCRGRTTPTACSHCSSRPRPRR